MRELIKIEYVELKHIFFSSSSFSFTLAKSTHRAEKYSQVIWTTYRRGISVCHISFSHSNFFRSLWMKYDMKWLVIMFYANMHEDLVVISLHTCIISPTTKTIATQLTISAWFWITNSWLKIGGFFLSFLLPKGFNLNADDMAHFCHCWILPTFINRANN